MLYLIVVLAIAFYALMYILWEVLYPYLGGPMSTMNAVRDLIYAVPQADAWFWLKLVVGLAVAWAVFDLLFNATRRALRPAKVSEKQIYIAMMREEKARIEALKAAQEEPVSVWIDDWQPTT
jgi:hypothetical protein